MSIDASRSVKLMLPSGDIECKNIASFFDSIESPIKVVKHGGRDWEYKNVKEWFAICVSKKLDMQYKPVLRVFRHTVSEELFKFTTTFNEVTIVTPDHELFRMVGKSAKDMRLAAIEPKDISVLPDSYEGVVPDSAVIAIVPSNVAMPIIMNRVVEKIERVKPSKEYVYNLDVKDFHNYLDGGIIVG